MDISLRLRDPIAPQLVAALRQAIIASELRPGEALSEKEIAGRFGVSRQPVREAFIKLSEAGLVQILPSRGTFVMKISMREVANARFVREAVECALARAASRLITPDGVARLRRLIAEQAAAAGRSDYSGFTVLDEAFHQAIAEIVDCDYAGKVVESAARPDRPGALSLATRHLADPAADHSAQCHRRCDRDRRDADTAATAMRIHLREILNALPRIAAEHPDLFEDEELPAHTRAPRQR
jgi:DNA-binding GntR family transcriptional regulator